MAGFDDEALRLEESDKALLVYCKDRAHSLRTNAQHLNDFYPGIPCANFGCKKQAVEGYFFCSEPCRDNTKSRFSHLPAVQVKWQMLNKLTGYSEFPSKSE